jgi:hypothetical protein
MICGGNLLPKDRNWELPIEPKLEPYYFAGAAAAPSFFSFAKDW